MGKITDYWLEQLKPVTDLSKVRDLSGVRAKPFGGSNANEMQNDLTLEERNSLEIKITNSAIQKIISDTIRDIESSSDLLQIFNVLKKQGKALFKECVKFAQQDKPIFLNTELYWARLKVRVGIKGSKNSVLFLSYLEAIAVWEKYSRNLNSEDFDLTSSSKNIIVTGFDPFGGSDNPSGELSLFLNSLTIEGFKVHTAIFPVRWKDFDNNIFENFIEKTFSKVDVVFTTSRTNKKGISIDSLAGNVRGGIRDNNFDVPNRTIIFSGTPNFYPTTLPFEIVVGKKYNGFSAQLDESAEVKKNDGNKLVVKLSNYENYTNNEVLKGSGGSFLSNEIFYRACHWRETTKLPSFIPAKKLINGHLHIQELNDKKQLFEFLGAIKSVISSILQEL